MILLYSIEFIIHEKTEYRIVKKTTIKIEMSDLVPVFARFEDRHDASHCFETRIHAIFHWQL